MADVRVSIGKAAGRPSTDDAGNFAFTYVPKGRRALRALVGTSWVDFGIVDVPEGGTARFDLQAPGSSTLHGKLYVGGKPMDVYSGGLQVRIAGSKKKVADARPDSKGEFRIPHLAAGTYEFYAWCGHGKPRGLLARLGQNILAQVPDLAG